MVDQSAVGRTFAPVTARVEPGRLRFFLDTLGDTNPVYRDGAAARAAGFTAAPVPPTYLFCLEMMDAPDPFEFLTALDIDLARVLHGEQRFDYHAPVVVGDTLTLTSRVTEVTDKKGGAMTLIVIVTAVTNQNGIHVADTSRTVVVRNARPS
ncbi:MULTISPECIES: MaoC family dehydratase N-terminal domain-containing protein [Bradyrhizobium]|mgnify:CR=1 FL=1|jgi:acyl dehydratase|uniref:MaoC family dehydratase N-terminal domain-containing protein n=1 Tax=Bradyrhizobium TaxID=374 RepID=UPI000428138C|nr:MULTISPECIES: MaoC family dehydratase N-terminal domain-containing protein [Bradyrhizobium]KIU43265.1 acyl dehydratase [Bradyrhizobium elkanii]MBK5656034.1 MaoC family dehydratase N-terminal domain-containing protein [Rhizobium sp.]OCX29906.1 acyl dehydratase [Bradyrhizobium sp. UASWS1016]